MTKLIFSRKKSFPSIFIFLLFANIWSVQSQIITVNNAADTQSGFSPDELIRNVLIDGTCADVRNVRSNITGLAGQSPANVNTKSYGYFRRPAGSTFPFAEGIILSTGIAFNAGNTVNTNDLSDDITNDALTNQDSDLETAIGVGDRFTDVLVFEFDFVPTSTDISFRYLMASEEYTQNFPCLYSDSFAFLIRPEGSTTYENIAVIPGTTDPVSVTNVHDAIPGECAAENEQFYAGGQTSTPPINDTNFNGRTTIFTATTTVVPGTTYHIKLVIADAAATDGGEDNSFDTAVFLEAGSFNLGLDLGDDFVSADNTAVCGNSIPLTANIVATNYQWLKDGVPIPGATNQTYNANLGNGTYTCEISNSSSCTDSDDIVLEFVDAATINPAISSFQLCDPDANQIETFDLTSKDVEILNGQSAATFEVQYYSDSAYTTLIPNPSTYNNTNPTETIYARVVNRNSNNCVADGSFTIEVTGIPVPVQPVDYEICDDATDGDDTNGFVGSFLLNTKDTEILGTLDPAQYSVSYHTSLTGAQTSSSTDVIDKNNPYTNINANTQPIFVRVENVDNVACNDTSISFNLIVSALPTITATVELKQCDNDTDGFSVFNLNEAATDISTNYINETFIFYETLADAQA
ncbi:choice-of-anchor L domain-containing protein, partial [Pseudotenacibaculum sp. MALMAid0570]|uniref:choice-of-anchor L domain-containing protein n=1 Tax=Pseudotenacibaculum sp. MALMAid0570 TaxID=3143938 RepID=UPI0032E05510